MNPAWIHRLAAAAALALTATGGAWAQERIRIAGNFSDKHSSSIAIEQFKKDVEAGTGGCGRQAGDQVVRTCPHRMVEPAVQVFVRMIRSRQLGVRVVVGWCGPVRVGVLGVRVRNGVRQRRRRCGGAC